MRIPRYGPQTELIEEILNHFENPKNKEAWQAFLKDDRRRELFSANQAALGVARLAGREEIFTTIQSRVTNATLDRNSDISLILAWAQGFNVGAVVVADLIGETFTQEQYEILTKPLFDFLTIVRGTQAGSHIRTLAISLLDNLSADEAVELANLTIH